MTAEEPHPAAKVIFELEVDDDGWPPVGGERLWAHELGDDLYRIDNVPWFVRDIASGDVVRAVSDDPDHHPTFVELVEPSDHLTIRIIVFRAGPLGGDLSRAMNLFTPYGVWVEGAQHYGMLAIDIGPEAPLPPIVETLLAGVDDGSWTYEEGRINQAWIDLTPWPEPDDFEG